LAKTKAQKQEILNKIKQNVEESKSIVFASYTGLKVNETNELRKQLDEIGAKYEIVKNSLLKITNKDFNFEGPTAAVYSFEDEIAGIKKFFEFTKDKKDIQILGGYIDDKLITQDEVITLSNLPSKDEMIAKLIGSMNAPLSNFVGVNREVYSKFVRVIKAYKDKQEN